MLADLKDDKGRVKIDGFYDDVVPLTRKERKAWEKLPHKDARFRKSIGAPALSGEKGYTTLERIWGRPSLDVNGIWGGFTGEGAKTVIPAVARAKISMRLVPDQKAADIAKKVKKHFKKIAPDTVKVDVRDLHGGTPWKADTDHPALQAAGRAMERAFGAEPVFVREGGSIPIVAAFAKTLKVPCVLMGIGLNDDNLHAPNEKLDLANFERGNEAAAYLLEELGAMDVADFRGGKAKAKKAGKGKSRKG
jgi:acetylornithine deacetylase/succinyl-diaminopimelate desuccinylase-like protein